MNILCRKCRVREKHRNLAKKGDPVLLPVALVAITLTQLDDFFLTAEATAFSQFPPRKNISIKNDKSTTRSGCFCSWRFLESLTAIALCKKVSHSCQIIKFTQTADFCGFVEKTW